MRALRAVVVPPAFDDDLSLLEGVEDFTIEQFIAQLGVEALSIAILPGAAGHDVSGLGTDGSNPVSHGLGDKLMAVI